MAKPNKNDKKNQKIETRKDSKVEPVHGNGCYCPPPKAKILFVLKKRHSYNGHRHISYGLVNSCRLVAEALEGVGVESKIVQVVDNNCIDREVTLYKPTHCIVEALWVVPEKFEVLCKLHPKVQWSVRLHSQVPFLAIEGCSFQWILAYNKLRNKFKNLDGVTVNNLRLQRDLMPLLGFSAPYTPNIYLFESKDTYIKKDDNTVDIGCFGALRPLKNTVQQAIGAIAFADFHDLKLHFHVNSSQFEDCTDPILKNLRNIFADNKHKLVENDWSNHEDFNSLVAKMDLGLQVSFTETFNIVAQDFVVNNVPVVGSREVETLSPHYQADPTNSDDIAEKLGFAWKMRYVNFQRVNQVILDRHNRDAIKAWLAYLKI